MENQKQLQEKLDAMKAENVEKCAEKINEILKEFNCDISTNASVVINGQVVTPVIVSK